MGAAELDWALPLMALVVALMVGGGLISMLAKRRVGRGRSVGGGSTVRRPDPRVGVLSSAQARGAAVGYGVGLGMGCADGGAGYDEGGAWGDVSGGGF
ncbi:hypothetical protein [Microbacterium sp. NPDC096154]|uniref:hypothetical protein n=1 Tax=Microbacterium sp. NPDC096154 TaxID=3155549 RepID=UPI003318EF48